MNVIVQILVGGFTGWLTGKAAGEEGYGKVLREGHVRILDTIYGIVGGIIGEYLFFWIVIGKGNAFSTYATTVLGSITLVGAARLLAARWRLVRSYKRKIISRSPLGVIGRPNHDRTRPSEASAAQIMFSKTVL